MEGRIKGVFPGGPTRRAPAGSKQPPPTAEQRDAAWDEKHRRRVRRRRTLRVAVGAVAAACASAGAGFLIGLQVPEPEGRVPEALLAAQAERERAVSAELNRMLLEFRRMEVAEAARGSLVGGRP